MKKILPIVVLLLAFLIPSLSFAHPGRTDSSGCHTCRTNCSNWGLSTGEYHCHNAKALPQPKEPIKSTYGEQGTGHTTPAPEYKIPVTPKKVVPKVIEEKPVFTTPQNKIETPEDTQIETLATTPTPIPIQAPEPIKKKSFWSKIFWFW